MPSVSVHDCVPAHDADLVICGSIGAGEIRSPAPCSTAAVLSSIGASDRAQKSMDATMPGRCGCWWHLAAGTTCVAWRGKSCAIDEARRTCRFRCSGIFTRPTTDPAWRAGCRPDRSHTGTGWLRHWIVAGGVAAKACAGTPAVALAVVRITAGDCGVCVACAVIDAGVASDRQSNVRRAAWPGAWRRTAPADHRVARQLVDGLGARRAVNTSGDARPGICCIA